MPAPGGQFRFRLDRAGLDRVLNSTAGEVGKEIARRSIMVDRSAKNQCPVDTGRLRSSINWRVEVDSRGLVGIIGTNVEYAPYVEFGTSRARAQPFLRPALQAAS